MNRWWISFPVWRCEARRHTWGSTSVSGPIFYHAHFHGVFIKYSKHDTPSPAPRKGRNRRVRISVDPNEHPVSPRHRHYTRRKQTTERGKAPIVIYSGPMTCPLLSLTDAVVLWPIHLNRTTITWNCLCYVRDLHSLLYFAFKQIGFDGSMAKLAVWQHNKE